MIRDASDLSGYTIKATDGDIGEVVEFFSMMRSGQSGTLWLIRVVG